MKNSRPRTKPELLEKIRALSKQGPGNCIEFQGLRNPQGYGKIKFQGKKHFVHRLIFKIHNPQTSLSQKDYVCHKCDNPACINYAHLFLGNAKVNNVDKALKGRHANTRKTHCIRGHEFNTENTRYYEHKGRLKRQCKTCIKLHY